MDSSTIVFDSNGDQISFSQNTISAFFKRISGKEITRCLRQVPTYMQAIKDFVPTETVTFVFNKHTKKLLDKGASFGESKYGGFAANLYNKDGHLIGQAAFTEKLSFESCSSLSNSINQLMLQQQFSQLIDTLDCISTNIERVLTGQQNDRLSLCASAEQQLLEASKMKNQMLRQKILINVLQTAHQARGALTQTFLDDVKYLKSYSVSLFGKNYEKELKPRIQTLKQSILANYQAAKICAAVYIGLEEYAAMIETLLAFEKLLSSCLTTDTLEKLNSIDSETVGFWLEEPLKMSNEIAKLINEKDTLALEVPISLLKGVE